MYVTNVWYLRTYNSPWVIQLPKQKWKVHGLQSFDLERELTTWNKGQSSITVALWHFDAGWVISRQICWPESLTSNGIGRVFNMIEEVLWQAFKSFKNLVRSEACVDFRKRVTSSGKSIDCAQRVTKREIVEARLSLENNWIFGRVASWWYNRTLIGDAKWKA